MVIVVCENIYERVKEYLERQLFENLNGIPRYGYIYPYSSVTTEEKYPQRETLFTYGNLER